MTEPAKKRTRRGRGRSAKLARSSAQQNQAPYVTRRVPVYEVLDEEGLTLIENNADTILEEIGIEFRDDQEALDLWREAGADVQGERVRFPRGMCRKIIQDSAPAEYTQHARNPAPVDLPVNKRHFDMIYSHLRYSDKPLMGSVTAPSRAQDSVDMVKICFGDDFIDPDTGREKTVLTSLINANSPMTFDDTMLGAAKVYARHNQATVISPFILAGAMSPVTVAGTSAQILAEAMAGMAFVQLVRPGAPVVFGTFASSVSMQSGAPTFGSPEPSLVMYICASLARRLGVPFRSGGGLCASKIPDAQAAYESANTLQTAALAGVNFMLHAAGWLEGGLVMGYEKFMMDCDQAGMLAVFLNGVDLSENGQALSALREVGPGQHFLGCEHTQANFETAFYRSTIADSNSFEQWESEGAKDASERATTLWRSALESYQAPPMDPAVDEALTDYITQRKAAFPDANY